MIQLFTLEKNTASRFRNAASICNVLTRASCRYYTGSSYLLLQLCSLYLSANTASESYQLPVMKTL